MRETRTLKYHRRLRLEKYLRENFSHKRVKNCLSEESATTVDMENSEIETKKCKSKTNLWFAQVKEETLRYMGNTSLHGIKYAGDSERNKFVRFLWLAAVAVMGAMLTNTVYRLHSSYLSYPYETATTSVPHISLPLPSVWLCLRHSLQRSKLRELPHSDVIEEALLLQTLGQEGDTLQDLLQNATARQILAGVTVREVMDVGSFAPSEVIRLARLGSEVPSMYNLLSASRFTYRDMLDESGRMVRCYVLSEKDSSGNLHSSFMDDTDELTIIMQIPSEDLLPFDDIGGLYASIGHQKDFPSVMDQKINMMPGSAVTIVLTKYRNHFLPAPYRSMDGQDCEDLTAPGHRSPLRYTRQYSFPSCLAEVAIVAGVESCNCTAMSLDGMDVPSCTVLEYLTCFPQAAMTAIVEEHHNCKRDCVQHLLKATSSAVSPYPAANYKQRFPDLFVDNYTGTGNWLRVTVTFANTLEVVTEHKPAMTMDTVCTTLGGQMGLFIGASIITVVEFCEHILILLWRSFQRFFCNNRLGQNE